jgi:hypothetical protein
MTGMTYLTFKAAKLLENRDSAKAVGEEVERAVFKRSSSSRLWLKSPIKAQKPVP